MKNKRAARGPSKPQSTSARKKAEIGGDSPQPAVKKSTDGEPTRSVLRGIGVSAGIASGPAFFLHPRRMRYPKNAIEATQVDDEIARFARAVEQSVTQLEDIRTKLESGNLSEHSHIVDAHLMMLRDELLIDGTKNVIEEELMESRVWEHRADGVETWGDERGEMVVLSLS